MRSYVAASSRPLIHIERLEPRRLFDGGDFSLDFVAAAPFTYDHATGGGAFDDRTIGKENDVVESLEGGDFACGDIVTYLVEVSVDDGASGAQTIELDFEFLSDATGQSGVGHDDIRFVGINYGPIAQHDVDGDGTPDVIGDGPGGTDSGIDDDGGSVATLVSETLPSDPFHEGTTNLEGTVRITDLEAGETVILRVDVHIDCDDSLSPTGNLQAAITAGRVTAPAADTINVGNQTVPFKNIDELVAPSIDVTKTGDTLSKVGDSVNYTFTVTNTGNVDLFPQSLTDTVLGTLSASSFTESITNDNILQEGETWTLNTSRVVQVGDPDPLVNVFTAIFDTSSALTGAEATDSDDHTVNLFQPSIDIEKTADRSTAAVGDTITYSYTLDNTGSSDSPPLINVVLTDNNGTPGNAGDDFAPTFVGGDTDGDNKLDLTEIWTYTSSRVVLSSDADPLVNTVVVHANPDGFPNDITDTDTASVDLFQPAITIVKSGDALSKIGDIVNYTYAVTNTGSAGSPALSGVVVTDNNATPGNTGDDFNPTFVGGDTDGDTQLDIGETWNYTASRTVPAGASDPFVNIATATANVVGSVATVNDTDDHSVNLFQPAVDVTKAHTGGTPVVGNTLTYLITITAGTSSADTPDLVPDSIVDTKLGTLSASSFTESGIDDNKLQVGETWTLSTNYVVQPGDVPSLTNVVTVHFHPDGFPNDLTDAASVTLTVDEPSINIDKTGDALSKIGDQVTYTYTVTNTSPAGSVALENVVVTDDNATPGTTGDDFNPTFVGGDTDGDSKLDIGETWTYTATRTVPAGAPDPFVNVATVTANVGTVTTVNDTDNHSVNLFQPSIVVTKTGDKTLAGVGDTVIYTYTLDNNGSSDSPPLINVVLTDNNATPGNTGDDFNPTFVGGDTDGDSKLDLDEIWTYTATVVIPAGASDPYVNIASVASNPDGFPNVITDTDSFSLNLFTAGINIDKTGTALSKIGDPVTYTYTVTNTGSGDAPALENVVVTDDNATPGNTGDDFNPTFVGGDTDGDGRLDLGETWTYTKTLNVPAGASDPYVNIATVTANAVGSVVTTNDTDNHSVNLFQPFIDVTKAHTGGTPVVGNTLTYTITITAGASSSDTPDLIPDSIIDTKLGTLSASSFTESGIDDNKLQVGETWTLVTTYVVLAADVPSLTNTVTVHFHPDGFPNDITDVASVTLTVDQPPGGEGLTPGFWKNNADKKGAVAWGPTGLSPNQTLESVFNVPNSLGMDNVTLLQALSFKGGGGVKGAAQSLCRAAVAACLNAAHPNVDYPMTLSEVISAVNAALATNNRGTMLSLKDELDALNNLGGGIDQHGNPI